MSQKNKLRKRQWESEERAIVKWEQEILLSDDIRKEMETMWEIPQIFQFLLLNRKILSLNHLSMYETERMLLMPRASKQLSNIMTSLLSCPVIKKIRRLPPMPYEFWTNILMHKVKKWFVIYRRARQNTVQVLELIGVEPEFWRIFPELSSVEGKDFEELTFRQRVWLVKSLCDNLMHTKKRIQEESFKQMFDEYRSEVTLGSDRDGASYICFPQFLKKDLRVYKHVMDNKVLSSMQPPKKKAEPKVKLKEENMKSPILTRSARIKRRKSRWRNGALPGRSRRRSRRREEENSSDCKCSSGSVGGSLANEDTNFSCASACSNNNHSDLEDDICKRSRSSSKASEASRLSSETKCSNAKSSGYDTNASSETKSCDGMRGKKVFKGFTKETDGKGSSMTIIRGILDNLTSQVNDEAGCPRSIDSDSSDANSADEEIDESTPGRKTRQAFAGDTNDSVASNTGRKGVEGNGTASSTAESPQTLSKDLASCSSASSNVVIESGSSVIPDEEVSNNSKTDDEKLSEIKISGSSIVDKQVRSEEDGMNAITTTSKSDDEKLIETKASGSVERIGNDALSDEVGLDKWMDALSEKRATAEERSDESDDAEVEEIPLEKRISSFKKSTNAKERSSSERSKMECEEVEAAESGEEESEVETEGDEPNESDLPWAWNEEDAETEEQSQSDDSEYEEIEDTALGEILERLKKETTPEDSEIVKAKSGSEVLEEFNEMMSDLGTSTFELVADNIEALRNLISKFSSNNGDTISDSSHTDYTGALCEMQLLKKMTSFFKYAKRADAVLRESMKKARAKLHLEWTNFAEGVVENQDWSGAHGSNRWVLGSQGYPLSSSGEATLHTLPHSALSPAGTQSTGERGASSKFGKQADGTERQRKNKRPSSESDQRDHLEEEEVGNTEQKSKRDKGEPQKRDEGEEAENDCKTEESEQHTGRVLRARGISSYTEQLYFDEDVEDQLEGWPSSEAVNASPGAPTSASVAYNSSQARTSDDWSEEEDSDQDWILPGSRKRKHKRSSASRRLKSLEQKVQSLQKSGLDELSLSSPGQHRHADSAKEKCTKESLSGCSSVPKAPAAASKAGDLGQSDKRDSKQGLRLPSADSVCKVEPVDSVHSVLDIKEEAPPCDVDQNSGVNNYNINVQQSYVVVKTDPSTMTNYYVMQPNPVGQPMMPQGPVIQQGAIVTEMLPQVHQQVAQRYYVQGGQNYVVQGPQTSFASPQQAQGCPQIPQQPAQMLSAQNYVAQQNYLQMPYMVGAAPVQQNFMTAMTQPQVASPRGYYPGQAVRQNFQHPPGPRLVARNRPLAPRQLLPHPNGAVIRSQAPVRGSFPRNTASRGAGLRSIAPQTSGSRAEKKLAQKGRTVSGSGGAKTTSLIVLSDSDDEIEMIVTENKGGKAGNKRASAQDQSAPRKNAAVRQKPIVTSEITLPTSKSNALPPQIIQRMSQGGISITPVKPAPQPVQAGSNTQLVVVVNETGSHYALALPNGSKLILTPDQVAHIRASNGGKLTL